MKISQYPLKRRSDTSATVDGGGGGKESNKIGTVLDDWAAAQPSLFSSSLGSLRRCHHASAAPFSSNTSNFSPGCHTTGLRPPSNAVSSGGTASPWLIAESAPGPIAEHCERYCVSAPLLWVEPPSTESASSTSTSGGCGAAASARNSSPLVAAAVARRAAAAWKTAPCSPVPATGSATAKRRRPAPHSPSSAAATALSNSAAAAGANRLQA
mmetsp:Transcript_54507/g.156716  ORF Transcript_54507/g.156716 Transcript_54507/m.156716 type:complete len:212 (+) Transcript_54507:223-858(+)